MTVPQAAGEPAETNQLLRRLPGWVDPCYLGVVTALDAADSGLVPTALVALTRNV
jgi:hypothetical protein